MTVLEVVAYTCTSPFSTREYWGTTHKLPLVFKIHCYVHCTCVAMLNNMNLCSVINFALLFKLVVMNCPAVDHKAVQC